MAFGTGEHGSTRGCLLALDRLARQHRFRRVLDMGCGSGILGIAAHKVSGARVLGVDLDAISVFQARQNARRNKVANRVRFAFGDGYVTRAVRTSPPFDLVFANILARPLVRMAPRMRAHLAPGARVVLSGLLARQERMVLGAHRMQGLRLVRRHTVGEWRTLVLAR
jgi:ribosomal protein L11 methyltransferase